MCFRRFSFCYCHCYLPLPYIAARSISGRLSCNSILCAHFKIMNRHLNWINSISSLMRVSLEPDDASTCILKVFFHHRPSLHHLISSHFSPSLALWSWNNLWSEIIFTFCLRPIHLAKRLTLLHSFKIGEIFQTTERDFSLSIRFSTSFTQYLGACGEKWKFIRSAGELLHFVHCLHASIFT